MSTVLENFAMNGVAISGMVYVPIPAWAYHRRTRDKVDKPVSEAQARIRLTVPDNIPVA